MEKRGNGRNKTMRERIALEAGRLMAEDGVRDYALAKRKAALHLAAADTQNMPSNQEIEQALIDYQRLFQRDSQPHALKKRRELAVQAMQFFADFHPRLVGAVLNGTAGVHSDIDLHVFSDTPEAVALFLMEHNVPYQHGERRLRVGRDQLQTCTVFRFVADDIGVDLTVFPLTGMRQAPLSPVDGKPMRRASVEAVRKLAGERY